jgi:hypothetical protein
VEATAFTPIMDMWCLDFELAGGRRYLPKLRHTVADHHRMPILVGVLGSQSLRVVKVVRALMLGQPIETYGWSLGILILGMRLAAWLFRRRISS